ncbi:hypothetical protein NA78x_001182 [Anatilimnocola sp. NA78]|uniref:hypothetical protein n=1 Tax=Anatilimnocola sp. NA78 TaxID=3415683 RepID=UPI003CE46BD8
MPDELTWLQAIAIHIHTLALALTAGAVCWAAMLAGLVRLHWFWRISLLCAPLLLLLPIRAYEPLVMLFPLVLGLAMAAAMLRKRWEAELGIVRAEKLPPVTTGKTAKPVRQYWKMSLGDALLTTTVIAVVLSVLVQLPWRNLNFSWVGICFDLVLLFAISLICLALVGLRGGIFLAICLFGFVCLGIIFESTWGDGLRALYLIGVAGPQHLTWVPLGEFYLLFTTLLLIGLWFIRWCWQAVDRPVVLQQRRRLVASLVAMTASPAVVLYMAMFVGPPAVPAPQIRNNALPQLVTMSARLEHLGVGEFSLQELRSRYPNTNYPEQVEAIYDESLKLVKQPGCVALELDRRGDEDSLESQNMQLASLRTMARRWHREAELAYREGNMKRGVEFDLATLRLGNHLSRGGICIHAQAAAAIKNAGLIHLAQYRDHLPSDLLPAILSVLDSLDAAAENPQLTHARDRYWTDIAHGWRHRLEAVVQRALKIPSTETNGYQALAQPFTRESAQRRLLATDLALRLFHHQNDRYPQSLKDLVPHLLIVLPLDPFTQQPLVYHPLKYGYVLYSTGPDAQDDGGKFHRWGSDAYNQTGHDWNLESVLRPMWRTFGRGWGATPGAGQANPPGIGPGFGPRFGGGPRPPGNWTSPPWEGRLRGERAERSIPDRPERAVPGVLSVSAEAVSTETATTTIESRKATAEPNQVKAEREPAEARPYVRRPWRRTDR